MLQNSKSRLKAIEERNGCNKGYPEFWVDQGDGIFRHRDGRKMTREEFMLRNPDSKIFTPKIGDIEQ